jgi:hypothetical protein
VLIRWKAFEKSSSRRPDGLNLYAYCGNNPVNYYDPSGYAKKTQNSQTCKDDDESTAKSSEQTPIEA